MSFLSLPFCLLNVFVELDALGDDFLGEVEDSSYLDAVEAPDPPTGVPGENSRVKVC